MFPAALPDSMQREELVKNVTPPAGPAMTKVPSPAPHVTPALFCLTWAPAASPASLGTILMTTVLVNHAVHSVEVVIHRPAVPPAEIPTRSCSLGTVSMRPVLLNTTLTSPPRLAESVTGVAVPAPGLWAQTACSAWMATFSRMGLVWSSACPHFTAT